MLQAAIMFFIFGASIGAVILMAVLKDKPTPKPAVVAHGILGGFAILMCITYIAMGHTDTMLLTGVGLLLLAAIGGFYMFGKDVYKLPIPKVVAVIHPMIALSGVILLIVYVVQMS